MPEHLALSVVDLDVSSGNAPRMVTKPGKLSQRAVTDVQDEDNQRVSNTSCPASVYPQVGDRRLKLSHTFWSLREKIG